MLQAARLDYVGGTYPVKRSLLRVQGSFQLGALVLAVVNFWNNYAQHPPTVLT